MRAVQVIAPGQVEFIEMPMPELKPGHALVRPLHLSLCGSDIHMIYHSLHKEYPFPPGTSGHEMVGEVIAIDPDAENFDNIQVGDMTLTLVIGHQSMAEYYLAPLEHVLPLPGDKPIEHFLQAQQLGTVIYASKRLPSLLDKTVAVIGQGSAGLWFNLVASRMGARQVIGVDVQEHRLHIAPRYGATHTVHCEETELDLGGQQDAIDKVMEITGGEMVDVVIEAAGEINSINLAVDLVKWGGFILFFGVPRTHNEPMIPFAYEQFFFKNILANTVVDAMFEENQSSSRLALEWIANGIADPGPMLTHHFTFDQVMDAYELQRVRDEGAVKIIIDMPRD